MARETNKIENLALFNLAINKDKRPKITRRFKKALKTDNKENKKFKKKSKGNTKKNKELDFRPNTYTSKLSIGSTDLLTYRYCKEYY